MTYTLIRTRLQVWDQVLDSPVAGTVIVTPSVVPVKDVAGNRLLFSPAAVHLDADGWYEADLPASDDPGLTPTAFGYTFDIRTKSFNYSFTTQVRLADATLVTEVNPETGLEYTHYELDLTGLTPVAPEVPISEAVALRNEMLTLRSDAATSASTSSLEAEAADASAQAAATSAAEALGHANDAEAFAVAASAPTAQMMADVANDPASAFRAALTDNGKKPVGKDELVFNVKDYGALGDGATDDAAAINAAVTACNAAGGGDVLVPPSSASYMLSTSIVLKSNVRLLLGGNLKAMASSTGRGVIATNQSNVAVIGLPGGGVIDMNRAATTNGASLSGQQGVYLVCNNTLNLTGFTVRGVTVKNGWARGIHVSAAAGGSVTNVVIEDCTVVDVGDGAIYMAGTGNADHVTASTTRDIVIRRNNISSPTVAGRGAIQCVGCSFIRITDNVLDGGGISTSHGITMSSSGGASQVTDFIIEGNLVKNFPSTWGICMSVNCTRFTVANNQCHGNGGGITVDVEDGAAPDVVVDVAGIVSGNSCLNSVSSHGINTNCASNLTYSNNRCSGAAVMGGIAISVSSGVTVIGNVCKDNAARGIAVFGSVAGTGGHYIASNDLADNAGGDFYIDPLTPTPVIEYGNGTAPAGGGSSSQLVVNVKDYGAVGDGIANDWSKINDAITAAGPNGTVFFPPGVYAVNSPLTFGTVTLDGAGAATIKKTGASTATFITIASASGTVLRGLKIDCNSLVTGSVVSLGTSTDTIIEHCTITNAPSSSAIAVRVRDGVNHLLVQWCVIDGVSTGAYLDGACSFITFAHNRIKNWSNRGIYTVGSTTLVPSDVTLLDNRITDMVAGGAVRQPIVFEATTTKPLYNIKVNHNTVLGPNKAWTAADPGTADQISLHDCIDFEVIGNISKYGGDGGLAIGGYSGRGVVANNVCSFNDVTGVFLGASTSPLFTTTISGNTFMNNGQARNGDRSDIGRTGIRGYNTSDCVITGNTLGDDQATKTQKYGVSLNTCTNIAFGTNVDAGNALGMYALDGTANVNITGIAGPRAGVFNVLDFGAKGDGVTDDTAAIQDALDNAVGTLYFPPGTYKVTGTGAAALTLTRNVNLVGSNPRQSFIRGDSLGATTDVLAIKITDNEGSLDVRNWRLSNLRVLANASGRHAIYIGDDTANLPMLTCQITGNNLTGYATNGGYSLYIDNNLAHSEISGNTISSSIYAKCRDANVFRKNTSLGLACFITFDVIFGVHNNTVSDNTIVNRDGAVHIINGDAIRVVNNQIELGASYAASQSPVSAMVWVEGAARVSYNTVIENNNFGGGTDLDHLIYIDQAQKTVITKNQFVACNVAEVHFTANAKYNVLKRDNYTRGTTSNPRTRTSFKEEVIDLGEGNSGARKDSSSIALQNGWTGGAFFKDDNGLVHFVDVLSGGTTGAGTVIGTLPVGFRPLVNMRLVVGTSAGSAVVQITSGTGVMSITTALPSNAGVTIPSFASTTST